MLAGWREGQSGYADQVYASIYALLWQTLSTNEKQLLHIMMPLATVGATAKQLQATAALSRADFWSILMRLIESCLVEPRGAAHKKRYGIHSLTRHFIQSQVYAEWPQAEMVLQHLAYWQGFLAKLPAKVSVQLVVREECQSSIWGITKI